LNNTPSTVLLVDDHRLFREGLALLLRSQPGVGWIHEAGTIDEALAFVGVAPPVGMILLDIALPGVDGLAGMARLQQAYAGIPILVLSGSEDPAHKQLALGQGAAGFVEKSASGEEIGEAILRVWRGDRVFPPIPEAESTGLTPRQEEVLHYLCEGLSNKAIARQLLLSENTVRVHVSAILALLGATSRTEAVVAAHRRGWIR
jgi:two-component system, NarL family, nitrate/nitrite response regulator NarL